ncbi:hypothetical protein [Arcobacter lacus]|uniref:Uncharacterized protein n=1 Tax=Arcobacter lacus TaxID=1912876 RepID=A0ABX5JL68_9BACT|nr:hypothetical protein [Arcobacter lacus]PUE67407.1 hypothetical protein B0175_00040 [Arcobacter lacus]
MDRSLKALDLLKEQYNILNNGIDGIWINPKKLDEAIKELEDLENRSCNNCLYFSNSGHGFGLCNKGVSSDFKIGTFYCNKWEVKNECS